MAVYPETPGHVFVEGDRWGHHLYIADMFHVLIQVHLVYSKSIAGFPVLHLIKDL